MESEPEVRAPIAASFDTLAGIPYQAARRMQRPSRDWGATWQVGTGSSHKSSSLADLFKAPGYKFMGTLQEACLKAENEGKAIIVNIQSVQVFDSHLLNRDVWSDSVIKQMIAQNFILFQWDEDDPEGRKYIQYYNCYTFPHLAILNPSIRKEVKVFSDRKTKTQVQEVLFSYLEQESTTKKRAMPEPFQIPESLSSFSSNEEEMLQAAIKASMEECKDEIQQANKKVLAEDPPRLASLKKHKKQINLPSLPLEPEQSDQTTNLRVKLPDGSKLLRRFCLDSKAQLIFNWCANVCKSRDFKLSIRFPKKVLAKEDFSKTLRELQFRNMQLFLTKEE